MAPTKDPAEPGEIAYRAYRLSAEGRSLVTGKIIPEWGKMPEKIRQAWRAAADAMKMYYLGQSTAATVDPPPFDQP